MRSFSGHLNMAPRNHHHYHHRHISTTDGKPIRLESVTITEQYFPLALRGTYYPAHETELRNQTTPSTARNHRTAGDGRSWRRFRDSGKLWLGNWRVHHVAGLVTRPVFLPLVWLPAILHPPKLALRSRTRSLPYTSEAHSTHPDRVGIATPSVLSFEGGKPIKNDSLPTPLARTLQASPSLGCVF